MRSKTEIPFIVGNVERKRAKKQEKARSIELAKPAIRESQRIIEKLMQERQLMSDDSYYRVADQTLWVQISTTADPIDIRLGRTRHKTHVPPSTDHTIDVSGLGHTVSLTENAGQLLSRKQLIDGPDWRKPLGQTMAQRYLDLLRFIQAGVESGAQESRVVIKSPLINKPTKR